MKFFYIYEVVALILILIFFPPLSFALLAGATLHAKLLTHCNFHAHRVREMVTRLRGVQLAKESCNQ